MATVIAAACADAGDWSLVIDEDDPADPPRWGNGKLNVPETFGMWRRHLLLSDWYDSIERCRETNHA